MENIYKNREIVTHTFRSQNLHNQIIIQGQCYKTTNYTKNFNKKVTT